MWARVLHYDFAPALVAALAVAALGGTALPHRRRAWRAAVGVLALAALAAELPLLRAEMQRSALLGRDVVAWLAFGPAAVLLTAAAVADAANWRNWPPAGRVATGAAVVAALAAVSPFVVLLVHCTSGDCL